MEVEIISEDYIKPETPTPPHLRVYKFSVLDQLSTHAYTPYVLFYLNSHTKIHVGDEQKDRLKQSLSETLARFYPLAGEVKDNLHVECNDNGVYYVEAQVTYHLSDFLRQPKSEMLHKLAPFHPASKDLLSKKCVASVQVSFFKCGGVAICLCTSHKVVDGYSAMAFWKSWSATTRRSSINQIFPVFNAHELFPPNPSLREDESLVMWPSLMGKCKCIARSFVFDASAIMALKVKATKTSLVKTKPSRVVAILGLVWKCIMAASYAKSGLKKPSVLSVAVNLRAKISPPLPPNSMGNILWFVVARFEPNSTNFSFGSVVDTLQDAMHEIDHNYVEQLKGEKGSANIREHLKKLKASYADEEADYIVASSLCHAGFYEVDFGWGEPSWLCNGSADADSPALTNLIVLTDTKSGGGIEALVSLDERNMRILEHDLELLAFASINPSPHETTTLFSQPQI